MRRLLSLTAAMGVAVFCVGAAPTSTEGADYDWRLAVGYSRGVALADLYPEFARTVEEMSGGRIAVEIVYDGEGVNQEDIYSAVRSGLVQIGLPYMALFHGEFPPGLIHLGLPGGPADYLELRALFHRTEWAETLREAYAEQGLYLLGEEYQLPTYVLTKEPIESLDDFDGQRIRAPGAYGGVFRELGAAPVVMAYDEVYTGLATGVIDGVDAMNIVDFHGGKFHEIAGYLYPLPVTGSQVFPILVNMDAWNELPEDLQAVMEGAANRHAVHVATSLLSMEREALNEMEAEGLEMSPPPSEEDRQRWLQAGQEVWDEHADDPYSERLIEIQREFMSEYGS